MRETTPQDDAAMSPASTGSLAWFSVTERMPGGENVLWLVDEYGGFHHAIGCVVGDKIYSDEGIQYWITKKTFWMPLPAPPTNAKDQRLPATDSPT